MRLSALRFVYNLPRASEDLFVAELWQRGTLGVEVHEGVSPDSLRLDAYFPPALADAAAAAAGPGERGRALGAVLDRVDEIAEQDWLAAWRAAAVPFPVGRRFLLDPREPEESAAEADPNGPPSGSPPRTRLRLPARGAFGTGSHETTRLALELLEGLPLAGRSLLDVGTGTGVLAFAALALGAARAAGCDVDPVATFHAAENRRLNRPAMAPAAPGGEAGRLGGWAGGLAALSPIARFDVVVANVLPERILPDLSSLVRAVADGGSLVYSGALAAGVEGASDIDEMAGRFATLGLVERRRRTAGEWAALELARA